jgi:hypothetical protein
MYLQALVNGFVVLIEPGVEFLSLNELNYLSCQCFKLYEHVFLPDV